METLTAMIFVVAIIGPAWILVNAEARERQAEQDHECQMRMASRTQSGGEFEE